MRSRWAGLAQFLEGDGELASPPRIIRHTFSDGVQGWATNDPLAQRVPWLGREALILGGGRPVLAPVLPGTLYTLRATLSGGPTECYVGFCFHVADIDNFETIYLAPHAGGHPEAIQYDPVIKGSNTWQVFGDADGVAWAALEKERWHRLRVDVWPNVAQVYVDDETSPKATFPLRLGVEEGRVGLWGYRPSYVAEFEVQPLLAAPPPLPEPKVAVPPQTVREWLVARYDRQTRQFLDPRPASAEPNGTLCLNRLYRYEQGTQAFAACEIEVPTGCRDLVLEIGYSDRARVWLAGTLVHQGQWTWDTVSGTDGRIRPGHAKVSTTSKPGWQLVLVEVTAFEPGFGWGITMRAVAAGSPCQWKPASRLHVPKDL